MKGVFQQIQEIKSYKSSPLTKKGFVSLFKESEESFLEKVNNKKQQKK